MKNSELEKNVLSARPTSPPFCTSSSTRTRSEVTNAISIPENSAEKISARMVIMSQDESIKIFRVLKLSVYVASGVRRIPVTLI